MSWVKAAIEGIARHGEVRVRPSGDSMRGCIESGQRVTIVKADYETIIPGDVVFVQWKECNYILHLVLRKRDGRLLIGNNLGKINGWADGEAIIGKVVSIDGN